ncbi:MAG: hypothetical protein GC137_02825 [Alphaproteobacteria bacterium]|nr:hypothetical protein [Alphaproteobacteria bacterium]
MNISEFEKDIFDLFYHVRGGHVQKYCFSNFARPYGETGAGLWHDFVNAHDNYYPIRAEIALIPEFLRELGRDYDTLIDFGPGDERAVREKILPVVGVQKRLKRYTAIDSSLENLRSGTSVLNAERPDLEVEGIHGDFYDPQNVRGLNRLGVLLGATISNQDMRVGDDIPFQAIVERMRTLGRTTRGEGQGHLVLSFDNNPDLKKAVKAYEHPSWMRMMTGLMYDVQTKLNPEGDFSPSLWHYVPIIDNDNHVIQQGISPSVDQSFSIGGHEFNLKRADLFVITNNIKFPHDLFMELVEAAGLRPNRVVAQSDDHPMVFVEATA